MILILKYINDNYNTHFKGIANLEKSSTSREPRVATEESGVDYANVHVIIE